jgi:hypothetical protein
MPLQVLYTIFTKHRFSDKEIDYKFLIAPDPFKHIA